MESDLFPAAEIEDLSEGSVCGYNNGVDVRK